MVKPAEIGNIEFSTSFRGYNPDQVDDYVDNVVKQYTEAYNAGAELEKICKAQKARIAELEAKLANAGSKAAEPAPAPAPVSAPAAAPQKPSVSDEEIENSRKAFETYRNLAAELKESVKGYKAKIFALYQNQISELQKFDADDIVIPDFPEIADVPDTAESVETKIVNTENSAEAKNSEKIAHLVSELGDIGTDGEPYEDDTDVSSLIDDISDILNAGIEEIEVNNEGSGEKNDIETEDAAYANPFNQMFITDDIG